MIRHIHLTLRCVYDYATKRRHSKGYLQAQCEVYNGSTRFLELLLPNV